MLWIAVALQVILHFKCLYGITVTMFKDKLHSYPQLLNIREHTQWNFGLYLLILILNVKPANCGFIVYSENFSMEVLFWHRATNYVSSLSM